MAKFRKKPVVIEAVQWPVNGEWPDWLTRAADSAKLSFPVDDDWATIHTLEGKMRANVGDWIIQGIKGEIYPCKPDIFEATYDAVEETVS